MDNIPLSYNEIDAEGLAAILKFYHGRHHQEIVGDFEKQISGTVGSPHVAAVQSGTAALHLALRVVGVQSGDCVMVPTFAYVATVSPVKYLGAIPVFIDSEKLTWNMDPMLLEDAISKTTKSGKKIGAIVVVHNYGMPAQMDALLSTSKKWGIPLVEDAAESFGSKVRGKWTGTLADVGVFSFNSNKTITGFGGGALVSSNEEYISRATYLASHARSDVPFYQHEEVGYNYRMSPLTAAYGLSQLKKMPSLLLRRSIAHKSYCSLGEQRGFRFQQLLPNMDFQPWLTACTLPMGLNPAEVLDRLARQGVEGRRMWKPMHLQPAFLTENSGDYPVSESMFDRGICLPAGPFPSSSGNCELDIPSIIDLITNT